MQGNVGNDRKMLSHPKSSKQALRNHHLDIPTPYLAQFNSTELMWTSELPFPSPIVLSLTSSWR
jgi:hypothetical protein